MIVSKSVSFEGNLLMYLSSGVSKDSTLLDDDEGIEIIDHCVKAVGFVFIYFDV